MQLHRRDVAALFAVIHRLHQTPIMSRREAEERRDSLLAERIAIARQGYDPGPVPRISIMSQSGEVFRIEMARIFDDLGANTAIFEESLDLWWQYGELPPILYPSSIQRILRQAQVAAVERAFLAVFCLHFASQFHASYGSLIHRAQELRAIVA